MEPRPVKSCGSKLEFFSAISSITELRAHDFVDLVGSGRPRNSLEAGRSVVITNFAFFLIERYTKLLLGLKSISQRIQIGFISVI